MTLDDALAVYLDHLRVERALDGEVPPEIEISEPAWFDYFEVGRQPEVVVEGRIGAERAGFFN